ncbi:hypothetical protein DRJ19_03650, partial [Candidatus Woesearchaeota archaeon]
TGVCAFGGWPSWVTDVNFKIFHFDAATETLEEKLNYALSNSNTYADYDASGFKILTYNNYENFILCYMQLDTWDADANSFCRGFKYDGSNLISGWPTDVDNSAPGFDKLLWQRSEKAYWDSSIIPIYSSGSEGYFALLYRKSESDNDNNYNSIMKVYKYQDPWLFCVITEVDDETIGNLSDNDEYSKGISLDNNMILIAYHSCIGSNCNLELRLYQFSSNTINLLDSYSVGSSYLRDSGCWRKNNTRLEYLGNMEFAVVYQHPNGGSSDIKLLYGKIENNQIIIEDTKDVSADASSYEYVVDVVSFSPSFVVAYGKDNPNGDFDVYLKAYGEAPPGGGQQPAPTPAPSTPSQTCAEINGEICDPTTEFCSAGGFVTAADTAYCCLGECLPIAEYPDLIIKSAIINKSDFLTTSNEDVKITVQIQNASSVDVDNSINWKTALLIDSQLYTKSFYGIKAAEIKTAEFSIPLGNFSTGLHSAKIIVDYDEEVEESDETNNETTLQFAVYAPEEICWNAIDDDNDGETDEGCMEICNNGVDDDLDDLVDEDCYADIVLIPV